MRRSYILWSLVPAILASGASATADPITLTDTQGRSINGQILEITEKEVRFQTAGLPATSIPLSRLSEDSRATLRRLQVQGLKPAESWPTRGSITSPYTIRAEGNSWIGTNVRLVFGSPIELPKNQATSPEVAVMMSVDTALAAAKGVPLGLIEEDRIFECRIVDHDRLASVAKAWRAKHSPSLAHLFDGGYGGSAPLLGGSGNRRLAPQVFHDEDTDILYIDVGSIAGFLEPDLGPEGPICPVPERHRILREAAVKMAFGKYHHRIPLSLRSSWYGYFTTIDSVLGADLDYRKLVPGLKKLGKKGLPSSSQKDAEFVKYDPEMVIAELAADKIPKGNEGALLIYYLLHMDENRRADSFRTLLGTALPEDQEMSLACDRYRAEVATFNTKVPAYNRALQDYFAKGGDPYGKPQEDNPRPTRPVPPPASLEEFLKTERMLDLATRAESKRLNIVLRNRSGADVAADFSTMIKKALR